MISWKGNYGEQNTTMLCYDVQNVCSVYSMVHRVHKEWQWPLTGGLHSIMMVKSAKPARMGGARPLPFTLSTIMSKVVVYAPAERADTPEVVPPRNSAMSKQGLTVILNFPQLRDIS